MTVSPTSNIYVPASIREIMTDSLLSKINSSQEIELIIGNSDIKDSVVNELTGNSNVTVTSETIIGYTKYDQLINISIYYSSPASDNKTLVLDNINVAPDSVINVKPINIMKSDQGKFWVEFTPGQIKEGSSIDIKNYTDDKGFLVYDVRVFDINGVLYARGIFKYWYI